MLIALNFIIFSKNKDLKSTINLHFKEVEKYNQLRPKIEQQSLQQILNYK